MFRLSLVALIFVFAGCSGSGPEGAGSGTQNLDELDHSSYEAFDLASYPEAQPEGDEIVHDIPDKMLDATTEEVGPTVQNVQGFRIQLVSSVEKQVAVQREEAIKAWWRSIPRSERPGFFADPIRVYLHYRQPYYRVRVGNFSSRQQAEQALAYIQSSFPDAFIAIDNVTVYQ